MLHFKKDYVPVSCAYVNLSTGCIDVGFLKLDSLVLIKFDASFTYKCQKKIIYFWFVSKLLTWSITHPIFTPRESRKHFASAVRWKVCDIIKSNERKLIYNNNNSTNTEQQERVAESTDWHPGEQLWFTIAPLAATLPPFPPTSALWRSFRLQFA